ncbi:hypothetical protein [Xylophilus sp. GOD-11R]|uniref:hypothetical protein n=1 Tax=Xylophilus sp. GOD-11R TaxID=3089814 RepID=UPI00298CCFB7|nr:hypothetical protein [Xylophilus sp. GOD-11R]WPB58148.1 hypothetical protein R9X41_05785 [Xylophilus sp. GOD-11R]
MKKALIALAIASTFVSFGASAMTKDEHKAAADQISATYKTDKAACDGMSGNAKDICTSEAKGKEKIAKAELDAQYKPSAKADRKVRDTKADAAYDTAKEKCDDQTGNAKDVCVKEAKAAQTSAKADAKVAKTANDAKAGDASAAKVSEERKDASKDKREADYKVAKERCDTLSGNAKDTCVNDAKTKFGM